jgi:hypothetical protein
MSEISTCVCSAVQYEEETWYSHMQRLCHLSDPAITSSNVTALISLFVIYLSYILSHTVIAFRDVKLQTGR